MGRLKITPTYLNPYEGAYHKLSSNKFFNQNSWERWAKKGELDMYITMLANSNKITDDKKFYSDYMLDYSNNETFDAALYNELFADRTNSDTERERVIVDAAGKEIVEKYTASDYDYYKSIINARNSVNYQEYLQQQEQERKDSMNSFVKALGTVGSIFTEAAYGFVNQLDNLSNSVAAIGNAVGAVFTNKNIEDAIVQTNASDTWRYFENAGIQDWILDFERRYTHMRDLDGNYSGFGKYAGGIASTLGQLLPSIIIGKSSGSVANSFGASTTTANTVAKVTSSLVFYQGVTAGNVRDMYQEMASKNVSVPSGAILANAGLKSALQWAVEVGLAKFLGGTALDNLVFGRQVSSTTAKSLTGAAAKRLLKDFAQEGLEEVFQDTSDFLVNKAFTKLIGENFGEQTLTWQSLMDAFIIGGLASFAGSARQIITTRRQTTPNFKTNKDGSIVYDKDKKPVFKKLNKLASWEYGLDMQSFVQNFTILQRQGENILTNYDAADDDGKKYAAAFTEMYAAYRMISSIYSEIGDERFKAANDVLTKVTDMINSGKFNSAVLQRTSGEIAETLQGLSNDAIAIAEDKLAKAEITKIAKSIERNDNIADLSISDNSKTQLEQLFKIDETVNKVLFTEDGNNIVVAEDLLFVPIKYANKVNAETIYETVAEQRLIEGILKGQYKGFPIETVASIFKQVSGKNDATTEEALYNLIFNESFFKIVLSTANKDVFKFVSSLIDIEKSVVPDKIKNKIYKQKLNTVISSMTTSLMDYLVNQQFADYKLDIFTDEQLRKIAAKRWCRDLYNRVVNNSSFKKLTNDDWTVLTNRVNALPIPKQEKEVLLKNLQSEKSDVRLAAMNRIANAYEGIFTTNYDGKTYMPDTSIPNRAFNAFLQKRGLTIRTLLSIDGNTELRNTIKNMYGDVTSDTILKFRQKQFSDECSNYMFMYNDDGRIGIYEANTGKQVGFAAYNAQKESLLFGSALDKRTIIDRGFKQNYLITELLNSSVDAATAAYLSIDDVITDPSLLKDNIRAVIATFGDVNSENTFLYLRKYFIDKTKTTTVIILSDGSYAFGDVKPMLRVLKTQSFKFDKTPTIKQLIKPEYLYGRLENIHIHFTDKRIAAEYSSSNNTIYINKDIAQRGGNMLTFAFLHEFQHAMQVENSMNIGINADWINLRSISKTVKQKIIADVRKHRPELFKDITKGSETEAKIVNDFVYYSSGESTALGIDASELVDFYPTIVKDAGTGTIVTFPWGTSYNITNHMPMSFAAAIDLFDIDNLSDEAVNVYKEYIIESYNIAIASEFSDDISNEQIELFKSSKLYHQLSKLTGEDRDNFLINLFSTFEYTREIVDNIKYAEDIYKYFYGLANICTAAMPNQGWFVDIHMLINMYLPKSALRIKLDTLNSKQYSTTEFVNEYYSKSYKLSEDVQRVGKLVFDKFMDLSLFIVPNIKKVGWGYMGAYRAIQFALGFQLGNLLRFHTYSLDVLSAQRDAETYLHETIHYLTGPILEAYRDNVLDNENLNNLITQLNKIYSELKSSDIFDDADAVTRYPLRTLEELMSGASNEQFLSVLRENRLISDDVRRDCESLVGDAINDAELLIKLIESLITNSKDIELYKRYFDYVRTKSSEYQSIVYQDTHNGITANISWNDTRKKFYRQDWFTGEIVYEDEPNYFKTYLDPLDTQSLKASSEQESKLIDTILASAKEIYNDSKKKLTYQQLSDELEKEYQFVPKDILDDVAKNAVGDTIAELSELNDRLAGKVEETAVKKPGQKQSRKTRYVGQKASAGTNLEKFGYVKKYKKTQMLEELASFINNATENIDEELWNKVKSGTITVQYIMDYFRDTKQIDDKTFKLINDSFFHNTKITTFKQLQDFVDDKTPKYYAARAILKKLGYENAINANTNLKLLDKIIQIIDGDSELKKLYDDITGRYYSYMLVDRNTKEETYVDIPISSRMLRRLWMQYFDGSFATGGYVAAIAKVAGMNNWLITGESTTRKNKSLQSEVADDLSLEEVIADTSAEDAFEYIWHQYSREDKIKQIIRLEGPKYLKKLIARGFGEKQAMAKLADITNDLYTMSDEAFKKQYEKIVGNMTNEQINKIFAQYLIADTAGIKIKNLSDNQLDKLSETAETTFKKIDRPSSAIVNNINGLIRTIKLNLSDKDRARFIKANSDIFTNDFKIKAELIRAKGSTNVEKYLAPEKLIPLEDRVRQLSKDVRAQVYKSARAMNFKKQMEKEIKRLERSNAKLIEELANGKVDKVVTYDIRDETITVKSDIEMPDAVKHLLNTEFAKSVKTKTQYIVEGEEEHLRTSLTEFTATHAEFLQALSQEDINQIADFYMHSEVIPSTNKARLYSAVQTFTIGYLLKGNKLGKFVLTEEQRETLLAKQRLITGVSAQNVANWKSVMKWYAPEETIVQSLAKSCDIEFSPADIRMLVSAVETGDVEKISAAKERMYTNAMRKYTGRKTAFLTKLQKLERMMMLSGPGTWVRNRISNVIVRTGNYLSGGTGHAISLLIEKLFPKKKWRRDKQYKIIGTKVTPEVSSFIKTNFIDNKLLLLVRDGLSKYDVRKHDKSEVFGEDALRDLILTSIQSKIFQDTTFKAKWLNKAQGFILKRLSDDKAVEKAAIRYFGKILVEDKVDLSKGLRNKDVLNHFAEAYKLAAFDYMHKSNFFNKIEHELQKAWGNKAYFLYKQIFPFAAASWNWFVEGLNYTPIGLVKAIINFAKLENTIERLDNERNRWNGNTAQISSRFAEYLAKRDIGKGVIGSIGTIIGITLAALGYAGIDEEDDKYKLFVHLGDEIVYVDISEVFGTQGIMLGIVVGNSFKEDGNFMAAIAETLDTIFLDSAFSDLYNSFRTSDSFGEWLSKQPYSFLNMFVPNFLKTLSSVLNKYKIQYSSGILGKFEQLVVNTLPGLTRIFPNLFPKQIDPYTGEKQVAYKMNFVTQLANKLLPFKIYP